MNTNHTDSAPADIVPAASASTGGPRRRPGGRSARVRAAVFEATIHLLVEKGYDELSFATIAARAGVHETSLYRRWKTKELLVIDAISSRVAKEIPLPDTGTFRSDLIQILQYLRTFLLTSVGQALVQTAIATSRVPSLSAFHRDYWSQRRALLRPLFDRAIARGELSPHVDTQMLLETLIGIFYMRMFVVNEQIDETLPERVVDLVLSGVSTGKPPG